MEQELPKGWKEVKIEDVGKIITGNTPSTKKTEYYGNDFPFFKPTDLNFGYEVNTAKTFISKLGMEVSRQLEKNSTLVTCIGATIGKTGLIRRNGISNQQINAITPYAGINPFFVYYQVTSSEFQQQILQNASSTTLPILNKSRFSNLPFKLPPLPEQKRIVQKLDGLLGKVKTAQERLDKIPDILKRFRQSVLAQAVSGKLTEEWRKENISAQEIVLIEQIQLEKERIIKIQGKKKKKPLSKIEKIEFPYEIPKNWIWSRVDEISTLVTDGKHGDCENEKDSGYYFLSVKDMKKGELNYSRGRQITKVDFEQVHKRTNLESGDILISSTGATIGKTAIAKSIPVTYKTTFQKSVAIIKCVRKYLLPNFVEYFLLGNPELIQKACSGSAQPNLLLGELRKMPFSIPPIKEQKEIVRQVQSLFALADRIEARYQILHAKVKTLPQAILAKAFRGELVPQDPTEEPAAVLLERIKMERLAAELEKKVTKKRTKKKK